MESDHALIQALYFTTASVFATQPSASSARLVALGRTNAEIGTGLWITENSVKQALKRIFRKLEVLSRTEMVARLSATQDQFLSVEPSPSNLALSAHQ